MLPTTTRLFILQLLENCVKIICMERAMKSKRAYEDYKPVPQNSLFIVDEVGANLYNFVVKALKNLLHVPVQIKAGGTYSKVLTASLKRPVNGRVRIVYERAEGRVYVNRFTYWVNKMIPDEFVETEFTNFSIRESDPAYELFGLIEGNYEKAQELLEAERIAKKNAKRAEKVQKTLDSFQDL